MGDAGTARTAKEAAKEDKKMRKEKQKAQDAKEEAAGAQESKSGADVGKIVNLMSTDASNVADMIVSVFMLYGAPLELLIGGIYLYRCVPYLSFLLVFDPTSV